MININQTVVLSGLLFFFLGFNSYALKDSSAYISSDVDLHIYFSNADRLLDAGSTDTDDTQKEIEKAVDAFALLKKNGSYANILDPNELKDLPIGIREVNNSVEYGIVVTKAQLTPEYTLIDVYARIVIPQQGANGGKRELYFGAQGLKLSYAGRLVGDTKLSLLGDVQIAFNNSQWMLTLQGGNIDKKNGGTFTNENTYVVIDCEHIKEMSLKGNIQISRDLIVPINDTGQVLPTGRVQGDFLVRATDWNDIIVKTNLTPFAVTTQVKNSNKGYFSFVVREATLDFSDLKNDPAILFPKYYRDLGYLDGSEESWRGLYVKTFQIMLPEEFKSKGQAKPIAFSAENLIIDKYGVSGLFSGNNLFSIEQGSTGKSGQVGWAYSLDKLGIEFAASHIVGGTLEGKIRLPVQKASSDTSKKGTSLAYKGTISEDDYMISVALADDIDFNIFSAKATIGAGSMLEMRVKDKTFLPKVVLNGNLNIDDGNDLHFKDIRFQGLTLQTVAPYILVNYFGVEGEQQLMNFPISVSDIYLQATNQNVSLGFGIRVGLQENSFSASGNFRINGEIANNNGSQSSKYKGFQIERLALDNVDIGVASISGSLQIMKDDPVYGNGFNASLGVKIKQPNISVSMNATFGQTTFKYWGFEGEVDGLYIPTPYVTITGFTGGIFYHMIPNKQMTADVAYNKHTSMSFKPDNTIGTMLRAGVYGAFMDEHVASFMAGFNISTNANGGFASIGFVGEAFIMKDIRATVPNPFTSIQEKFTKMVGSSNFVSDLKDNKHVNSYLDMGNDMYPKEAHGKATIQATMGMSYDFNNNIFHAQLEVFVDVAGGLIRGTGTNGRAGFAVIHIAPKEWYICIGTPEEMMGLKMGVGKFSVEAKCYFMVGNKIPGSPPPPAQVAQILGLSRDQLDYMRDLNALGTGKGFAFGAHLGFSTGDMTALFLYASFEAGIGADIMLKNYGDKANCSNRSGSVIGIDGWYANGQVYAYLQGELGIKIKLFMINKKLPIIKAGVAALLQAKGPNPFWMRGYLGGYYELLGGLVKGRFRFKLEFGEECEIENQSVLGGMKIITDVTPKTGDQNIDVFAIPQATFAMKVNEPVVLSEDDGDHTYKILIDKYTIVDEKGEELEGKIKYGNTGDVAEFVSKEILPPNKPLKVIVQVSFQEKKNGIYEVLLQDGQKATETEERTFTTGGAPNHIPLKNVVYCYPVIEQENYYSKEADNGYIRLDRGQSYLFNDAGWTTVATFTDASGKNTNAVFSYNKQDNEVRYLIPSLTKNQNYTFRLYAKLANGGNTANTTTTLTQTTVADDDNTMQVSGKAAQSLSKDGEINRIAFNFKSSKYNTLKEKINALNFSTLKGYISTGLVYLQNNMNADEYFDKVELLGSDYTDNVPLIDATALMEDAFAQKFKDLFYNAYPILEITLDRATGDESYIDIPPTRALPIAASYITYLDQQKWNTMLKTVFPYQYDLFRYYNMDWYETVCKAANIYVTTPLANRPAKASELLMSTFGVIPNTKYRIKVSYVMPNGTRGTEQYINYEFK